MIDERCEVVAKGLALCSDGGAHLLHVPLLGIAGGSAVVVGHVNLENHDLVLVCEHGESDQEYGDAEFFWELSVRMMMYLSSPFSIRVLMYAINRSTMSRRRYAG